MFLCTRRILWKQIPITTVLWKLKDISFPWAGSKIGSWRWGATVGQEGKFRAKLCLKQKDIWRSLFVSRYCTSMGVQVLWQKTKSEFPVTTQDIRVTTLVKFRSRHFCCVSYLVGSYSVQPYNNSNLILRFPFSVNPTLRFLSAIQHLLQMQHRHPSFCFACHIYTSHFPSKCPQEYQGSTAKKRGSLEVLS